MSLNGPHRIEALLFDIGGVLIDVDFQRALQHWAPLSSLPAAELQNRFTVDQRFQQYECGQIDTPTYVEHLRQVFALEASDAAITAGWNAILVAEIEPVVQAVQAARRRLPCYAFSNTSRAHYARWSREFPRVPAVFERLFLSFELGLRKPDPLAFRRVAQTIGRGADRILFFDDSASNVEGARAAGLQAVEVRSYADVTQTLARLGVT